MLTMDYGGGGGGVVGTSHHLQHHQYASSTMSSETTLSGSCGSRTNRIRTVRLVRPAVHGALPPPSLTCRHGPTLGFSLRGGREHGTGFFVSHVEPGSEARRQGLRIGDQIIRVNGFTVDDAVHKEVLQLISNHTHLTLKVRSVGMIPVKDKKSDTLSWQIITAADNNSSLRSSPQLLNEKVEDVRISIMVAPRSKLGCGICKGPEWKPGIFVQFTKEGGIAREAGLRPGDQILFCNSVDFSDILFNEAVNLMKTSRQLDLIVRKSAGSELFPGESSGYNSSASSVTGDQSPSWSESKRLSIVKEESFDLEDRLDRLKCSKKWEKIGWDKIIDPSEEKQYFKPTIINLSENGTTIKNNGNEEECNGALSECNSRNQQQHNETTKTIVVEVHRTISGGSSSHQHQLQQDNNNQKTENISNNINNNNNNNNNKSIAGGPTPPGPSLELLVKSSSTSSFGSLATNSTSSWSSGTTSSNSLSSAICLEIQRRCEKKTVESKPSIDEQLQMKKILKGVATEKQQQHSKLMDEFKKAHRRMFKSSEESQEDIRPEKSVVGKETMDRIAGKELSQKLSERLSNLSVQKEQNHRSENNVDHPIQQQQPERPSSLVGARQQMSSSGSSGIPPPPPPLPPADLHETDGIPRPPQPPVTPITPTALSKTALHKTKPKAPPVPVKTSTLSSSYNNGFSQPPPCPTPDYDTLSITSTNSLPKYHQNGYGNSNNSNGHVKPSQNLNDSVEMESLESFKLTTPPGPRPKPPDTYFNNFSTTKSPVTPQLSNGSTTSSSSSNSTVRRQRPVSVTIGEYPSGTIRRQPGKLDFLQNGGDSPKSPNTPISSQLASELAQTLNRSNLRKRTESMENLLNCPQIKPQSNGSVRISLNSNLTKTLAKSTNDLSAIPNNFENLLSKTLSSANRVTINVNLSSSEKKTETPSGILKTGGPTNGHKPLVQQKSITFGEMPTVINDRPLHVT